MKCPKCGSNRVQKENYHTFVEEIQAFKYMSVVRCESCKRAARHESYDRGKAIVLAKEKFNMVMEAQEDVEV